MQVKSLGAATMASLSYFTIALLSLHALRTDYEPRVHFISDYAVGPWCWIMTTAFLALAAGCLSLGLGLFRDGPAPFVARVGALGFIAAAVGLVVTAAFPTDVPGAPLTLSGDIHEISFRVNVLGIMAGVILVSSGTAFDPRWRRYRTAALLLMLSAIAAVVLQFATLRKGAPYGYANRLFVVVVVSWMWTLATALESVARAARAAPESRPA